MNVRTLIVAFASAVTASPWAASAAIPTGAGPYNWADYFSTSANASVDARPETALTADQTWIVEAARTACPFWPGCQELCDFWQIWTGASVTATSGKDFRIMKGNVVFENAVISQAAKNFIGYTGPVQLKLRNGGSFLATGSGVSIGCAYNNGTAGTATVFMEEPSSFAASGQWIDVGATLPGALWMDGGLLTLTNGTLYVGDSGQEGYVRLNGGKISLRSESANTLLLGFTTPFSSMHISGGELTAKRSSYAGETYSVVGDAQCHAVDFYMDAGKANLSNERFLLGRASTAGATATMTIDGTATFDAYLFVMGRSSAAITTTLNLNGGRFAPSRGCSQYDGSAVVSRQVNLNGGTVAGNMDIAWPATVYPKGGTIKVASGTNTVALPLKGAAGYGVTAIALTSAGSGYVTAPQVTISGGSGHGATGYAVLAKDRTVERVVVTCRGEGYAAHDALTVAFTSTTGSGAAATVTLGENTPGTLHKVGTGTWRQSSDMAFDGDISVEEGYLALDGVAAANLAHLYVRNGAEIDAGLSLDAASVRTSAVNRVDVKDGLARIGRFGDSGRARLSIGELHVDAGLLLVPRTNSLELALAGTEMTATSASDSPIVNGLVYGCHDSSGYRSPSLFERAADGTLSLVTTTATPSDGANFCPSKDNTTATAPELSSLNCVILPRSPACDYYVRNSGQLEIKSGMIVCRRPHSCVERFQVTGGGALTTRAKGGMFIYNDMKEVSLRSYSQENNSAVYLGNWRRIYGPFADPAGGSPMALTVAGENQGRPEKGTVAWLLDADTYSGGLNLVNGGVVIAGENNLGRSGTVTAAGNCSVTAYNHAFSISAAHPIDIKAGANLMFCPSSNTGNEIKAKLTGEGALLTSDISRSECAIAYTGDHTDFAGSYYVMGCARIAPATFSTKAAVCLADGTNGVGVIETSGSFTRPCGTGKGELCWKRHATMPSSYGLRGGFSAKGGDLTVNLGGAGAKLAPGAAYLPAGAIIQLQGRYADGALDFRNGFELNGRTQTVSVWSGKAATLSGNVSDAVGGGRLKVDGSLAFAGTLEVGASNLGGNDLLAVNGTLDLTEAKVSLNLTEAQLAAYAQGGLRLASATQVTGCPALVGPLAGKWRARVRGGILSVMPQRGLFVVIR